MSVERVDLARITPQPWKNGAGLTREIAIGGTGHDFDWRLSVAEVDRDAPFSAFPGIDRCITLLRGAGMRLRSNDGAIDHALTTTLAPFGFSGDAALEATLVDGSCSDFNVMTRRGRFRSEVEVRREAAALTDADATDVTLLLGCAGDWLVDEAPLAAMNALLWRTRHRALVIRPMSADAALIHVRLIHVQLCHDRQP